MNIQNILVATNLSNIASLAYSPAIELANHFSATLHVVLVTDLPGYFSDGPGLAAQIHSDIDKHNEQQLHFLTTKLAQQCQGKIRGHLRAGKAGDEIVATAKSIAADCIVMATSGRTGTGRLAIGSVTEAVIRNSNCPVLCIHGQDRHSFLKAPILLATDLSENSKKASPYAAELAKLNEAPIYLLNTLDASFNGTEDLRCDLNQASTTELIELHAQQISEQYKVQCFPVIRIGDAAEQIELFANRIGAGLIVMSTHGRTGLKRVFLGSVAESVVRKSQIPVLCVRSLV